MEQFPEHIKFRYNWRSYQQRVLDELEEHLDDNHLHIIAPPGSGKTILGLEVVVRLNKPTVIFAPTISIRNQWIHRFMELFLQEEQEPGWISRDIRDPKLLTVVTYQALHAACTGNYAEDETVESEEEGNDHQDHKTDPVRTKEIVEQLLQLHVGTLVVDEAHHLKNAWWESLIRIKQGLNATLVGLTATPPYDVSFSEWQRYLELNGPVDAEISVPELVVEGDLCPHQDYIHFCVPSEEESEEIQRHQKNISAIFQQLVTERTLIEALEKHPVFAEPLLHLEWIYTHLENYSSILIFLNAAGIEITRSHLNVIGNQTIRIPELTYEWMETVLTFYLYKDQNNFTAYADHQESLRNRLKRNGLIERRTINFRQNRKISQFLGTSIRKLDSIHEIVRFEQGQLKEQLRMVILTDYIRKEYLTDSAENNLELKKIGVLSIFEKLRRGQESSKIGVLTGSLIIIPCSAINAMQSILRDMGISEVSTRPLAFDPAYHRVLCGERMKQEIVHVITRVFEQGDIEILIGTKSLLGEGWDAPSINSLILSSFVGSYVLSNQMRGRAIRTERKNLEKTGNIWHLVCIDPSAAGGGDDMELLRRRFKAFVGVSFGEKVRIENGIDRLDLATQLNTPERVNAQNQFMFRKAAARDELKKNWHAALGNGIQLIEEIKIPFEAEMGYEEMKSLYYFKTIKYFAGTLILGVIAYLSGVLQVFARTATHNRDNPDAMLYVLLLIALGGILFFGRMTWKTFRLYVRYRDISKDVHQIGMALCETLVQNGVIHTSRDALQVITTIDESGIIFCHLQGGTTYEKSVFIKALLETIDQVDNPRYLIIRKSLFVHLLSQKDYHPVPDIVGTRKEGAERFEKNWKHFVGNCELVYTRTLEGRSILLKSRMNSLASQFSKKPETVNQWK